MEYTLFNWLLDLIGEFGKFGTWLTTNLPYINVSPLAIFSVGGLSLIISALLVRLFVGG